MSIEAEHRPLCEAIDTRAALLETFQVLMNERLEDLNDLSATGDISVRAASYEYKRVRLEPTDEAIFAAYINELDAVYAQTDETLRPEELDSIEPNWSDPIEKWIKDPDTGYFQYRGKLTLPFDFRESCRSRWYTAPLHHRQESRQLYEDVNDPDNTLAFKSRITTRFGAPACCSSSI